MEKNVISSITVYTVTSGRFMKVTDKVISIRYDMNEFLSISM